MSPQSSRRLTLLVFAIGMFLLTDRGQRVYRPWVRAHAVQDFGLADTIGSLGGTPVMIFLLLAIRGAKLPARDALSGACGAGLGCLLYEFLQPVLGTGVFDWRDVLAVMIGFIFASSLSWLVWKQFPDKLPQTD